MENRAATDSAGSVDFRWHAARVRLSQACRAHHSLGCRDPHPHHGLGLFARRRQAYGLSNMPAMLDILYFAWVREQIGTDGESIDHPGETVLISELVARLSQRGKGYAEAFAEPARLRAALDQAFVPLDAPSGDRKRGRASGRERVCQ